MATFTCSGAEYLGILEGFAGRKAGMALSREQLIEHIPRHSERLPVDDDGWMRVRHEEMEEAVRELLFNLGAVETEEDPSWALTAKYFHDAEAKGIVNEISELFFRQTFKQYGKRFGDAPIDGTPVLDAIVRKHGKRGLELFKEFCAMVTAYQQGSLSWFRRTEWKDVKDLDELFKSSAIAPTHGEFLDQRFVDYLSNKFDAIDSIHWRQFEALAAEFFSREGWKVELGPGQDDGGVDLRVWRDRAAGDISVAPTILVQCKRQKSKVGQVVVKALWADVVAENAESGLIVTTSALQPGAANVCTARGYRVSAVDRAAVAQWLHQLRTPGSGVFMSR